MTEGDGAGPDARDAEPDGQRGQGAQDAGAGPHGQGTQDTLPAFGVLEPMLTSIVDIAHEGTEFRFLIANPFDYVQAHHARGELYETDSLAVIARHFPQGGSFVDIGAHVGNHAIFAARHLGAEKVIAFEPGLVAHTVLAVNKALNGLTRFDIRKQALSDREGEAVLATPAPMNLGRNHLAKSGPGQRVPVLRGDAALAGQRVSFLKIDVEGHEMQVLRGCAGVIAEQRPVIFAEVQDHLRAELDAWCAAHGYRIAETVGRYVGQDDLLLRPTD